MTVDQIEAKAERIMNTLDRAFMRNDFNQEQYDKAVKALDEWTDEQYKALKYQKQEK